MTQIKNAENVRLFALNSNRPLAENIAHRIGLPLSKASISHFADGEIKITIDESVRGCEGLCDSVRFSPFQTRSILT